MNIRSFVCLLILTVPWQSTLSDTTEKSDDCVYMRNLTGYSIVATFDGVQHFHVASAQTEKDTMLYGLIQNNINKYRTFSQRITLPFSIAIPNDFDNVIELDIITGQFSPHIKISENGYSIWIPRCIQSRKKTPAPKKRIVPEEKGRFIEINFRQ